jgi:hypothetical protein
MTNGCYCSVLRRGLGRCNTGICYGRLECGERMKMHVPGCSCDGSGEEGGEMYLLLRGICMTGFSSGGLLGRVYGQLHEVVWLARDLLWN